MNRRKLILGSAATLTTSIPSPGQPSEFCQEIARIIALVSAIKTGQTRSTLDNDWNSDGGISLITSTRYKLRSCESIKIDVDFHPSTGDSFNDPNAVIAKVSLPYLQHPHYD